jgi:hypothetical protein
VVASAGPLVAVSAAVLVLAGCSDPAQGLIRKVAARVTNAPWHEQHGWKAADFFTDPQVIALCHLPPSLIQPGC